MAQQRSGCGTWIALLIGLYLLSKCFGGHHEDTRIFASPETAPLTQLQDSGADYSAYSPSTTAADAPSEDADDGDGGEDQEDEEVTATSDAEAEPYSSGSYTDVDGHEVSSPVFSSTAPEGASAKCYDGSYSFSHHRRGTCSHHGGVAEWL